MNDSRTIRVLAGKLGLALVVGLFSFGLNGPLFAQVQNQSMLIDRWNEIKAPPAPSLAAVTIDPATTALLILDMQQNLTNPELRPSAAASIPRIAELLARARTNRMLVVYSNTSTASPSDIVPALSPQPGDPVVKSGVDKFFRTDLERILAGHGIRSVIVTGTAANGAVLYTATGAALRGLKVIVPIDGMSAEPAYVEQYVAWHLVNSPGTRNAVTLSSTNLITIAGS